MARLPIHANVSLSRKFTVSLDHLRNTIEPLRQSLLNHPLYRDMRGPIALRSFMEFHVFAVWDFMSLLKALQQRLCCVSVPWIPPTSPIEARLINEIVLGEETDEDGHGGYASHFDLYHRAMTSFGARTATIDSFLSALRRDDGVAGALAFSNAALPIRQFVSHTFHVIETGDLCQIASVFTFGREDLLPGLFLKIVEKLNASEHGRIDDFKFYLLRHVELDGDEHGPMAARLVSSLCGTDEAKWQAAEKAATDALQARLDFWDAIHAAIIELA